MMRTNTWLYPLERSRAVSNLKTDIDDFLIDPYYVPESTSLFSQLKQFQKQGNEVGMVVDEYGNFIGLVTLEDLIEQIIGRLNQDEEELGILTTKIFQ